MVKGRPWKDARAVLNGVQGLQNDLKSSTLQAGFAPYPPKKLIGDLVYDRDPLDETFER